MTVLIAQGAIPGGYSPYLLIWFLLLIFGILFIALALRGDQKSQEDDSIPNLEDLRNLPLRAVREAIRPPRPAKPTKDPEDRPRPRAVHLTGGPRGLVR